MTFDIGVLLTNSDLAVEGISNSIIEYMALKVPVIATYGRGTAEIIVNNQNGFLLFNRNINDLVLMIKRLLNNSKLYRNVSNAGRKTVETNFNMTNVSTSFVKLYKRIQ